VSKGQRSRSLGTKM